MFYCSGSVFLSGGRIDKFDNENIILSVGDFGFPKYDESDRRIFEEKYNIGKILSINIKDKSLGIYQLGTEILKA